MSRYFFDVKLDDQASVDEDGLEFDTDRDAEQQALLALGDIAREFIRSGDMRASVAIEVRDDRGPVLTATIQLSVKHARSPATQSPTGPR
jgi:hypothetical protein